MSEVDWDQPPALINYVKVCSICKRKPETCGHAKDGIKADDLRRALVWCSDWKPRKEKGRKSKPASPW